jgi:hypothetical protein
MLPEKIHARIDRTAAPQIPVILHHFHVQSSALRFLSFSFTFIFHVRAHDRLNGCFTLHIQE